MKMPFKKLLFLSLFLISIALVAQQKRRTENWYFGWGNGLFFPNGSAPIPFNASNYLDLKGGTAVVSDTAGLLLFYTGGEGIYNKNSFPMPGSTGIEPHDNGIQNSIIIPCPDKDSIYYVFHIAINGGSDEDYGDLKYSIVNMKLDAGLGDVTSYGISLLTAAEQVNTQITGIMHCNKKDYWVIIHGYNNDKFYSYLVTKNGISSPIVSSVGGVFAAKGYMKISPDGEKLAVAGNPLKLFDFNKTNGIVSNPINLFSSSMVAPAYGISFSPNSSKLYVSTYLDKIYQFDMDAANITSSIITLPNSDVTETGAIQNGPDGKMYVVAGYDDQDQVLGVINHPDLPGLACDFHSHSLVLLGEGFGVGYHVGLPNFIESYFNTKPDVLLRKSDNPVISTEGNTMLQVSGAGPFTWYPSTGLSCTNCSNPTASPKTTTTYYVDDSDDCTPTDSITVTVIACSPMGIIYPNVFSPNDDGVNDLLIMPSVECFSSYTYAVMNRWGNVVYEWNKGESNSGWDGRMSNGEKAPEGVYYYTVAGELITNELYSKTGFVQLVGN